MRWRNRKRKSVFVFHITLAVGIDVCTGGIPAQTSLVGNWEHSDNIRSLNISPISSHLFKIERTPALCRFSLMISFRAACLECRPALNLKETPWRSLAFILRSQRHIWGSQISAPTLRAVQYTETWKTEAKAIRISVYCVKVGKVYNQSPLSMHAAASKCALDT